MRASLPALLLIACGDDPGPPSRAAIVSVYGSDNGGLFSFWAASVIVGDMSFFLRSTVLLLAIGCGTSHPSVRDSGVEPDGGRSDAGRPPDRDSGVDPASGVHSDAGPRPTTCTGEALDSVGEPCFCEGPIVLHGDLVYRSSYEIEVIDVSNPADLRVVTTVPQGQIHSEGALAIAKNHLYVGGWALEVLDLANPRMPVSRRLIETDMTVSDVGARGDLLWIGVERGAGGTSDVVLYDITTPDAPAELGSLPILGGVGSVVAWGADRLVAVVRAPFGSEARDRAVIIDVSDPAAPAAMGEIPIAGSAVLRRRAAIEGDLLFVAGNGPLLQILDLAERAALGVLEDPRAMASGFAQSITVRDGLVYLGVDGVWVADAADPSAPSWIAMLESGNAMWGALGSGVFFFSNGSSLGAMTLECTP
jgi:hypothetical protein